MARNPYYDCSDNNGGTGGSVDLSEYPKKSEVVDFDGIENFSNDTKKRDTLYIKSDATLWLWDGTNYIQSPDIQNIPIIRNNNNENIAPLNSELLSVPIFLNSIAEVHLSYGVTEYWLFDGTVWNKKLRLERVPRVVTVLRESLIEDVEPTLIECNSIPPIRNDRAMTLLKEDGDLRVIEQWYFSTHWIKTNKVDSPKSFRTKKIANVFNTNITKKQRVNSFIMTATTTDCHIALPDPTEVKDKFYNIKVDEISNNFVIVEGVIDNVSGFILEFAEDFITVLSDGTEYHIINSRITKPRKPKHEFVSRENDTKDTPPTNAEFSNPILDDVCTISLSYDNTYRGSEVYKYNGTDWVKIDETSNGKMYQCTQEISSNGTINRPNCLVTVTGDTINIVDIYSIDWQIGETVTVVNNASKTITVMSSSSVVSDLRTGQTGVFTKTASGFKLSYIFGATNSGVILSQNTNSLKTLIWMGSRDNDMKLYPKDVPFKVQNQDEADILASYILFEVAKYVGGFDNDRFFDAFGAIGAIFRQKRIDSNLTAINNTIVDVDPNSNDSYRIPFCTDGINIYDTIIQFFTSHNSVATGMNCQRNRDDISSFTSFSNSSSIPRTTKHINVYEPKNKLSVDANHAILIPTIVSLQLND